MCSSRLAIFLEQAGSQQVRILKMQCAPVYFEGARRAGSRLLTCGPWLGPPGLPPRSGHAQGGPGRTIAGASCFSGLPLLRRRVCRLLDRPTIAFPRILLVLTLVVIFWMAITL
jgi:hypothetical protein